jgi:predicted dehydrogenase
MATIRTSRRDFLKNALGAASLAAGLPAFVPSSVFGAEAPSNRVNLGFIGVGGQGTGDMNNFLRLPTCQVVAVCDCYAHKREAAANRVDQAKDGKICTPYQDFRDLLARPDIDGVYIGTPDHWHVPIGILAAKAGKDVYIQKPLGLSVEQNLAMREVLKRHQRIFQYGTQQRSQSPHVRPGCELIRNGRLGKLTSIAVIAPAGASGGSTTPEPVPAGFDFDMYTGPAPERPYTKDLCTPSGSYHVADHALGFIAGWGAHPLDVMCWALGDGPDSVPVAISGTGTIPTTGLFDTPTRWDLKGRFANGVAFTFRDGPDETIFTGERGRISLSRGRWSCEPKSLWFETATPGEIHLPVSRDHYADFVNAIRERRDGVSNIDAAVHSDISSHLGYIAIHTGRTIRWDPATNAIVGDAAANRMLRRAMRGPWTL